jgi:hypothetical protein
VTSRSAARARARRDGGDDEHGEGDPVLAVGDLQPPGRLDVGVAERDRGGERGADRERRPPQPRDEQDGGDVDDAERHRRRRLLERVEHRGRQRDRAERRQDPDPGRWTPPRHGPSLRLHAILMRGPGIFTTA